MIGRGLRPADGKSDCIILDHSGAVFMHGLPEDPVEWTLDPERYATSPAHAARLTRHNGQLLECTQCSALRLPGVDTWTPDGESIAAVGAQKLRHRP